MTLLRAFRIFHNLDATKICQEATISRGHLTRLEQGSMPSPEVAEILVRVLNDVRCLSAPQLRETELRRERLEEARIFIQHARRTHPNFKDGRLCEDHLLYPERYALELAETQS
ncbi:helix-turn-helix domain-containing protein [Paraburkholderia sp. BR10872]|uniref:helix-turn-helix domain-containing protein n=1 Tax=Paraburkholderia sp. BR10872 TaxID=3236989 RepID=UPI0034D226F0